MTPEEEREYMERVDAAHRRVDALLIRTNLGFPMPPEVPSDGVLIAMGATVCVATAAEALVNVIRKDPQPARVNILFMSMEALLARAEAALAEDKEKEEEDVPS